MEIFKAKQPRPRIKVVMPLKVLLVKLKKYNLGKMDVCFFSEKYRPMFIDTFDNED